MLKVSHLLAHEGGESHWLGYSLDHGWLLLDRGIEGNEPGIGGHSKLRFLRLEDWKIVSVPRARWHDGSISFYRSAKAPPDFAALEAVLLEWRMRRKEWVAVHHWKRVPKLLNQRAATATRTPPVATEDDLLLCFEWANNKCHSSGRVFERYLEELVEKIGPYEASRLLSARRAERSTAEFYEELGSTVQDVSVSQLVVSSGGDWRDFDLDVGYPVDVKNSRATYQGREHFSEHAVARFKQERVSRREVRLVGVRSPYFPDPLSSACACHLDVTVLGEVSASEVERIVVWMDKRFGHLLKLRLWSPNRLPGWIFEYPDCYYSGRRPALDLLCSLIGESGLRHLLPGQWLIAEALGTSLPSKRWLEPYSGELRDLFVSCGLAKRCFIIYAMGAILRAAMNNEETSKLIEDLRDLARTGLGGGATDTPFGLQDPLGYVDRFLSAFECLGMAIKPLASHVSMFHLEGPDVLVASMRDGTRWTVLAYCGGWIEGRGRCGSSPLVIGSHDHCLACKHLICADCLFCSKDCVQGRSRFPKAYSDEGH